MRKAFFLPAAIGASASLAAIFLTGEIANAQACEKNDDCRLGDICGRVWASDHRSTVRGCVIDLEADRDRDGVPDNADNCPDVLNPGQDDFDRDRLGDRCDDDDDGDNVRDEIDNCPLFTNADQTPADIKLKGLVFCRNGKYSGMPIKVRKAPSNKLPKKLPKETQRYSP